MRPCRQLTCGRYSGQKCFSSKSPLCRIKKVCGGQDLRNVCTCRGQFRPVPEPSQVKSRPKGCLSHGRLPLIALTCRTLTARGNQLFFLALGLGAEACIHSSQPLCQGFHHLQCEKRCFLYQPLKARLVDGKNAAVDSGACR